MARVCAFASGSKENRGQSENGAPQRCACYSKGGLVRFLPVASDLDAEALVLAQEMEIQINEAEWSVWTRFLRASPSTITGMPTP